MLYHYDDNTCSVTHLNFDCSISNYSLFNIDAKLMISVEHLNRQFNSNTHLSLLNFCAVSGQYCCKISLHIKYDLSTTTYRNNMLMI